MKKMKYVIGVDLGTSGTKTVLFDEKGNIIADSYAEYPLYRPKNGWAEQNPCDWWKAAVKTIKAVIKESGVNSEDICSLGISGQMHGLVMLDRENRVLRNSIIWCDQRTQEECADIEKAVGKNRLIEITANPALTGFTASKILWVRKHEPDIYKKCAHILLPKDYVRLKLTGEYATDVSDASGMQLLDIAKRKWSDEVLLKLSIDKTLLADVFESQEITGYVSKEAASVTGLSEKTAVVAGAGDNAAAAVGTGTVCDGDAFTTIGTSGVVYIHTDKMKLDKKGRVHTFCCAVPDKWHVMGVTQAAGLSLKWFKDEFCSDLEKNAREENKNVYAFLDEKAELSGVGANRLIYLPYLMGERTPHLDPDARGVFFGLNTIHNRYDMVRAVMEGVGFSLLDCLSVFDEMGIKPNKMLACGGGGTSRLWRQILSDMFKTEISASKSKEAPALGAAILAMVGAKLYPSVEKACECIISTGETAVPYKENSLKYERLYRIYKKLYISLKDDFKELSRIGE